jgi:putative DNA primase/helicase
MDKPLKDWNDAIVEDINAREVADAAWARPVPELAPRASRNWRDHVFTAAHGQWPEPKPLPSGLPSVEPFDSEFLPTVIAPWVNDIANRLQCPPDYVAIAAITALGSVVGRRIGIKPQRKTDWIEIPNLWGLFIGRPGMLKSPAMMEALKPIHWLEAECAKVNQAAQDEYVAELNAFKLRKEVAISLKKKELKKSVVDLNTFKRLAEEAAAKIYLVEPTAPIPIRYRTNDSSYEAIGELLIANPSGILVERDEITSLLKHLDRDDQAVARGFYLSGWSGLQPYTFDRIGRGTRHVEAICIAVLGNTQPARISEYVRRANLGGAGGDGLIQRFGLLVWPDVSPDWRDVDEYPDTNAREAARQLFNRLSKMNTDAALKAGALKGEYDSIPYLRFDDDAAADFIGWREDQERRVRSGELSPAFEGHIAKYRKLVPALALINHLADQGEGPVSQKALLRALAFASYLESHAKRVYGSAFESELAAAKAIQHIRNGDIADGFTARDVHQRGWAHLTEREHVEAGLDLLVELDHLVGVESARGPKGGRPKVTYAINPGVLR